MLAAIEIYNKPTVEYREETFVLLVTNAWEVLLKARLVQQADGKIGSIYRRRRSSRRFIRDSDTDEPLTISLRTALGRVAVPDQVARNIRGLMAVRNRSAHLGILAPEVRQKILDFGTSSVQNFSKLSSEWFGETVHVTYLLPVGFIGEATIARGGYPKSQRELLSALDSLASSSGNNQNAEYSVALQISVEINRDLSGGGSIGITNDPNAPTVRIADDDLLSHFTLAYADVANECRLRYSDFRQNQCFNDVMSLVKQDSNCSHLRKLNPANPRSAEAFFYNPVATFDRLDREYTRRCQ